MRCSKPPETALRTGCISANLCCSEVLFRRYSSIKGVLQPFQGIPRAPATADAFNSFSIRPLSPPPPTQREERCCRPPTLSPTPLQPPRLAAAPASLRLHSGTTTWFQAAKARYPRVDLAHTAPTPREAVAPPRKSWHRGSRKSQRTKVDAPRTRKKREQQAGTLQKKEEAESCSAKATRFPG